MPKAREEKKPHAPGEKITEALDEALHPEVVKWDPFHVGEMAFELKPLTFGASKLFRKWAVPVLTDRMTPFEALVAGLTKDTLQFAATYGFLDSVVESEERVDANIGHAVAAICASQRPLEGKNPLDSVDHWAKQVDEKLSRKQVVDIFDQQCAIEEEVGQLGKSLQTRLESLAGLVGKKLDLPSLVQDLMQRATSSSGRTLPGGTTLPSSAGSSTDTRSTTPPTTPEREARSSPTS